MALRATKHKFTGANTPITSYDPTITNLGSLMVQNTGPNPQDKYVGPLPVAIARPMQEVVYTGNATTVSATTVTGSSTNFVSSMIGMVIGFGSTDPAKVPTWCPITAVGSITSLTITGGPTIGVTIPFVIVANFPMMYPHAITYSSTIDWVFLIENSTAAVATRRICLYEYNKTSSAYTWKGFFVATLTSATPHTIRGFRALRYLHTTGTVTTNGTAVTGTNTTWQKEKLAAGARIGFGSTDPTLISTWYVISTIGSDTGITLTTSAGIQSSSMPYVIEELRFAIVASNTTLGNGGLHLVKGVNYSDFILTGTTTIPAATNTDNLKAVYWLSDAGTTANVVTNQAPCGCAIQPEVSKGVHYAYVLDGFGSAYLKVYRYNLRATGVISSGKMTMTIAYTTTGTVTVTNGVVSGNGTSFTSAMVGMKIGFGSTSPALINTWYIIGKYTSGTSITLNDLTVSVDTGTTFIIDSADVVCTGNSLVAGFVNTTYAAVNNGRIGTLDHGPGAGIESLYFVTSTRIYRAAISKIYAGNLDWISDNRPEMPTGSINSYPATGALNVVEIADMMDRLIVLTTGTTGFRNYITDYSDVSSVPFDHIWGIDDKQQDQILTNGNAYISSGTVSVNSGGVVTGTTTLFTAAMVGFKIGFGTNNPLLVSTWYTISAYTSITSITLTGFSGSYSGGTSYVIDMNSNTVPHFNTCSQPTNIWSENGIAHIVKQGTTSLLNQMYALPLSAHWTYAATTLQRVITPILYTPDCAEFKRVVVVDQDRLGSGEFSVTPEPFRLYFRTKGGYDNSGQWTLVPKDDDLTGLSSSPRIQFMFEFVTIGWYCVPARIMSLTVIYDDMVATTDSHFQPSMAKSSATSKQFAWRFATAFSGTVPTLRVRFYDAVTGDLLLDDYTTNSSGTWEKTTDGTNWNPYGDSLSDKGNETTYIRYTPHSLYDNIKVRVVLTQ